MHTYFVLRWQAYHFELKQLLSSLASLTTFVVLLLYIALPAMILTPLISLSVIADLTTPLGERIIYQGCYIIVLYLFIRVQKKAILATNYRHYFSSLPVHQFKSHSSNVLLTLIAGNLPLIAPIALLFYLPSWQAWVHQLHFVLFGFSTVLVAWLAVKKETIPWLSLLVIPVVCLFSAKEYVTDAMVLNVIFIGGFLIELFFEPFAYLKKHSWPLTHYGQMRAVAMIKSPANVITRLFFIWLILTLVIYIQQKMMVPASEFIQLLVCGLLALLVGSYQFDNEEFYHRHSHYLQTLLNTSFQRYVIDMLPALMVAMGIAVLLTVMVGFSNSVLWIMPVGVLICVVSVSKFQQNFYLLPGLFFGTCLLVF